MKTQEYLLQLNSNRRKYHSKCIFNRKPPIEDLDFSFNNEGVLTGDFVVSSDYQGYDGVAHGGLIASIVDASMTQCLMGHAIIAYTTDISLHFRKPVLIDNQIHLETKIVSDELGILFNLETVLIQESIIKVNASGRFYRKLNG